MSDFKQVLQDEIRRLARKEIKVALEELENVVIAQRKALNLMQKRVEALEKCAMEFARPEEPKPQVSLEEPAMEAKEIRLNAAGIQRLRNKLDMSQRDFAILLGVSVPTISLWECGKNSPREALKRKVAALRRIGKKELAHLLAETGARTQSMVRGNEPEKENLK